MWPAGAEPIDLDAQWPAPILRRIVDAFSTPGARVTLLPWPPTPPTPRPSRDTGRRPRANQPDRAPGTCSRAAHSTEPDREPDGELRAAHAAVENQGRAVRVVHLDAADRLTGPSAPPFWADLVNTPAAGSDPIPASADALLRSGPDAALDDPDTGPADTDLVITSLRPGHGDDPAGGPVSDVVALVAARMLRVGGILAVLTHSHTPAGELVDPTGAVVASAQHADLLYLQHIVALHAPVRDGRFATDQLATAADHHTRAAHRADVRGLPAPHRRIHSDLLVFTQPHQHDQPTAATPATQALENGVIQ